MFRTARHQQVRHKQYGRASAASVMSLVLVLAVAWLLWSGIYKPMILGLGILSIGITLLLAIRMNFFVHTEGLPKLMLRLPGYWVWLLKEILVSSFDVARIVLSPRLPISPTVITLTSDSAEELPQVILGNSITLSPGTITIDIDESEVLVHCLTEQGANDLKHGDLMQRIRRLEKS